MQNPNKLLLLKPNFFGFNEETAANNFFQKKSLASSPVALKAIDEHQQLTLLLKDNNIDHSVIEDSKEIKNPDAVFLNNWFSIQPDSSMVLYPMWAKNRRAEINEKQIEQIIKISNPAKIHDFSGEVLNNKYCEGTGSLIFDHEANIVYASISDRTSASLVTEISTKLGYTDVTFLASDQKGNDIYHTNVLLSIGKNIVILCSEAIENPIERNMLKTMLKKENKLFIDINFKQMNNFCANVLEVNDKNGSPILLMSKTAEQHFNEDQLEEIKTRVKIASCAIPTIEQIGGGSLRCMLARG